MAASTSPFIIVNVTPAPALVSQTKDADVSMTPVVVVPTTTTIPPTVGPLVATAATVLQSSIPSQLPLPSNGGGGGGSADEDAPLVMDLPVKQPKRKLVETVDLVSSDSELGAVMDEDDGKDQPVEEDHTDTDSDDQPVSKKPKIEEETIEQKKADALRRQRKAAKQVQKLEKAEDPQTDADVVSDLKSAAEPNTKTPLQRKVSAIRRQRKAEAEIKQYEKEERLASEKAVAAAAQLKAQVEAIRLQRAAEAAAKELAKKKRMATVSDADVAEVEAEVAAARAKIAQDKEDKKKVDVKRELNKTKKQFAAVDTINTNFQKALDQLRKDHDGAAGHLEDWKTPLATLQRKAYARLDNFVTERALDRKEIAELKTHIELMKQLHNHHEEESKNLRGELDLASAAIKALCEDLQKLRLATIDQAHRITQANARSIDAQESLREYLRAAISIHVANGEPKPSQPVSTENKYHTCDALVSQLIPLMEQFMSKVDLKSDRSCKLQSQNSIAAAAKAAAVNDGVLTQPSSPVVAPSKPVLVDTSILPMITDVMIDSLASTQPVGVTTGVSMDLPLIAPAPARKSVRATRASKRVAAK